MRFPTFKKEKSEQPPVNDLSGSKSEKSEHRDSCSIYSKETLEYTGLRTRQQLQLRVLAPGQEVDKPWTRSTKLQRANKWNYRIFLGTILLGVAGMIAGLALSVLNVITSEGKYCLVLDEDFSNGLDSNTWFHEQQTGGFGRGEFEWTTDFKNNSFVEDGTLYIVPTFTADTLGSGDNSIFDGATLNLTLQNTCTALVKNDINCAAHSNITLGTVLPPIQSARLSTNLSHAIRYGKVEVKARMPTGDWIWPSIRLLPSQNVYGDFPASGEIDIFEGRGNQAKKRSEDMNNVMHSSLHWGPANFLSLDRYTMTRGIFQLTRQFFNQKSHLFGVEWTPKYIRIYQDTPVYTVFERQFNEDFWSRGGFPPVAGNTSLDNPWRQNAQDFNAAPFDQEFYLALSVAVGGTSGWFPDKEYPKKPWSDAQPDRARGDFWRSRQQWESTWPTDVKERAMAVESVKIWKTC